MSGYVVICRQNRHSYSFISKTTKLIITSNFGKYRLNYVTFLFQVYEWVSKRWYLRGFGGGGWYNVTSFFGDVGLGSATYQ